MSLLGSIPLILVGLLDVVIALLVLIRDPKKLNNVAFSLFTLSMGLWIIGIAAFLITNDYSLAITWAKLYYTFPLLIALFGVYFALSFPNVQKVRSIIIPLAWFGFILVESVVLFTNSFIVGLEYREWGKLIVLGPVAYLAYGTYIIVFFSFVLMKMYQLSKTLNGFGRQQARLFFTGLSIAALFGVVFNLILPFLGNYQLIHLGPIFNSFAVIFLAYAIIKHKMFDVRLVVARSLAYIGTLFVIASGFGFIVFGFTNFVLEQSFSLAFQISVSLATAIVALAFASIKKQFDRFTNHLFYRDAYDPQVFLDQLNRSIVTTVDIEKLLESASNTISHNMKSEYVTFGLRETSYSPQRFIGHKNKAISTDDYSEMSKMLVKTHHRVIVADEIEDQTELHALMVKNDIAVIARLVTTIKYELEGVGYLYIGRKKSGNPYSKQDISLIRIVANELVIAIENALRFEEIENFNVTLQQKVDDATKRLKKANEKLKQMDETKDEFISMASHQLRTPLTSVKGYVSMVLEGDAGPLNDMQKKLLEQSFISSQRMVFLIADLLNLSRLKTGKFIIDAIPTNLANVIQGEVQQLKETAAGKNLELVYNQPESFPTLMLDETKIRQVIMNFVDNAIYYTPPGGKIEINLQQTDSSVEFTVTDNGIGVPESEQHHLFNKFFRAKNAQKARPDGTGLGLFMAKKVIVAQNGALLFSSKVGKGSTFGFSFATDKILVEVPSQK